MLAEQIETLANEIVNDIKPHKLKMLNKIVGIQESEQLFLINFFKEYLKTVVQIIELDNLFFEEKSEILLFLNTPENISITNQIKIIHEQSQKEFNEPTFKLVFRKDYETGNKILTMLIKVNDEIEKNMKILHTLDQYVEYNSNFMIDLDIS